MKHAWIARIRTCGGLVMALSMVPAMEGCRKRSYHSGSALKSDRPQDSNACGEPGQPGRPNPAHCGGAFHLEGYAFNEPDMASTQWAGTMYSAGIEPGLFGTTTLYGPDDKALLNPKTGKPKVIRDLHYHLGGGRVGMRPIPVALNMDGYGEPAAYSGTPKSARLATGETIRGSELLDAELRKYFGLPADAPASQLWAIGANLYPGRTLVRLNELAETKSENSIGHSMVYIGDGWSRHAPQGLHDNQWTAAGYEPTTVIGVKLRGQKPEVVNANLRMVSRILNELNDGPQFPQDYTFDPVRVYNLQAALMFFAKWIEGGDAVKELKNSNDWGTYCAEFVTLALNIGLNVPLTQQYFEKIWPNGYGTRLWQKLQTRLPELGQGDFAREAQSEAAAQMPKEAFTPLWEMEGIASPAKTTEPSKAFAWPLETTADLIAGLIETFAAWPDSNPVFPSAALLGFAERASERVGVAQEQYFGYVIPAIIPIYTHHFQTPMARDFATWTDYVNGMMGQLALTGVPEQMVGLIKAKLMEIAPALANVGRDKSPEDMWKKYLDEIRPVLQEARKFVPPLSVAQQNRYRNMQFERVHNLLAEARAAGNQRMVQFYETVLKHRCNKTFVRFNAPPHLSFRVAQGSRPSNPNVEVVAIGTLFEASMLKKGSKSYLPEDIAPTVLPADAAPPEKDWDPAVFEGEGEGEVCGN